MRVTTVSILSGLLILIGVGCQSTPQPIGPTLLTTHSSGATLGGQPVPYRVAVPDGAVRPEAGWPMLLYLHGAGERGTDLALLEVHGPLTQVGRISELSECVIVVPQCPEGAWWQPGPLKLIVDGVLAGGDIDGDRIYVTGNSMGGYGTWNLLADYPDLFAAAVPICGGGQTDRLWPGMTNGFQLDNLLRAKDVPIHAVHGGKDDQIPLAESQHLIDALKGAGSGAKLTIYPEAGHNTWTRTYVKPELYEWMFAQRR